ncbi:hypothetical protein [Nostoc sp.]|uniref:hypothetical protein n=1 Tax=Nostoc sp. TaxID=1180 RepID=UPI002FFA8FD7
MASPPLPANVHLRVSDRVRHTKVDEQFPLYGAVLLRLNLLDAQLPPITFPFSKLIIILASPVTPYDLWQHFN